MITHNGKELSKEDWERIFPELKEEEDNSVEINKNANIYNIGKEQNKGEQECGITE